MMSHKHGSNRIFEGFEVMFYSYSDSSNKSDHFTVHTPDHVLSKFSQEVTMATRVENLLNFLWQLRVLNPHVRDCF